MIIDTYQYVSALKKMVEEGHTVSMKISGNSMSPFLIHNRDIIYFQKPDRALKTGDMVFYSREDGQYVMHRICGIGKDGYRLVGDAQTQIEYPVRREQIFALVTQVNRKGKVIRHGDVIWDFFEKIWIRVIPARPVIRKLYSIMVRR